MSWTKLAVSGLVIALAIVIWLSHEVWFAAFLGVLLALSLTGPAIWIRRYIKVPSWLATSAVLVVVLVGLAGLSWLIASPMTSQIRDMTTKLPDATEKAVDWLDDRAWGRGILDQVGDWTGLSKQQMKDGDELFAVADDTTVETTDETGDDIGDDEAVKAVRRPDAAWDGEPDSRTPTQTDPGSEAPSDRSGTLEAGRILGPFGDALASFLRAATLTLVSFVVALFLAFDPRVYERGVLWLVPQRHSAIARETMRRLATAMRWWMLGRLASMAVVAVLTSLGMWAIGMPAPMALGALAGLLSFVPNIGPIVSAVPGLILAIPLGPWMILGAAGVYFGAQLIESNAITPLIAQYAVSVPPGLLIVTQFILATLAGAWGLIIATPLLVVVMTLVQELYIRERLHKPIRVTGTKED